MVRSCEYPVPQQSFFFFFLIFIYLWLCWVFVFCARAFSSCGKRGPLFIAVRGPLTITASLVAEHRLQMRMLSNCGSRAQLLRGMWDPPRPGLEPASPAPAGRLSTTVPPGKPPSNLLMFFRLHHAAYKILVPRPDIEPRPWQWKCQVLTTGPPENSPQQSFTQCFIIHWWSVPESLIHWWLQNGDFSNFIISFT